MYFRAELLQRPSWASLLAGLVTCLLQLYGFWVSVGEASSEVPVELQNSPQGQHLVKEGGREAGFERSRGVSQSKWK